MKEMIAVSACLLGLNTKYNGGNNYNPKIEDLIKGKTVIPICPEVVGGLSIPRDPSEILDDIIISSKGKDVTKEFNLGARRTLDFLKSIGCDTVILKNGSPSCGNFTYDGTFTKTKVMDRMGITAKMLKDNGFKLIYVD